MDLSLVNTQRFVNSSFNHLNRKDLNSGRKTQMNEDIPAISVGPELNEH